jgi:hypothetical protein
MIKSVTAQATNHRTRSDSGLQDYAPKIDPQPRTADDSPNVSHTPVQGANIQDPLDPVYKWTLYPA